MWSPTMMMENSYKIHNEIPNNHDLNMKNLPRLKILILIIFSFNCFSLAFRVHLVFVSIRQLNNYADKENCVFSWFAFLVFFSFHWGVHFVLLIPKLKLIDQRHCFYLCAFCEWTNEWLIANVLLSYEYSAFFSLNFIRSFSNAFKRRAFPWQMNGKWQNLICSK